MVEATTMIELLSMPFMVRALIGGVVVAFLASTVGIYAVLRKASFFGDTIAHSSLTGVAIGILAGWPPLLSALGFSLLLSALLPELQRRSKLHLDAILGFLLPFSMALGILLLSLTPGYKPELLSYLFGSILSISPVNIMFILATAAISFLLMAIYYKQLTATAIDPTYAKIIGLRLPVFMLLHSFLLTLAIVPSISLVGIILVNALLIIPAATARQLSTSLKRMFWLSPLLAVSATVGGILISARLSLPTGPVIVMILGGIFLAVTVFGRLKHPGFNR